MQDIFTKTYLNIINESFWKELIGIDKSYYYFEQGIQFLKTKNDWKNAEIYFKKAIQIGQDQIKHWSKKHFIRIAGKPHIDSVTLAYINIGLIQYYKKHNKQEALKYFQEIINLMNDDDNMIEWHSEDQYYGKQTIHKMIQCLVELDNTYLFYKPLPDEIIQFINKVVYPYKIYDYRNKQIINYWDYRKKYPEEFQDEEE